MRKILINILFIVTVITGIGCAFIYFNYQDLLKLPKDIKNGCLEVGNKSLNQTIYEAAKTNNCQLLYQKAINGIDIFRSNEDKENTLFLAIENNSIETLNFLLRLKPNLNITDKDNRNLIYYAIIENNELLVNYLIKNKVNINIVDIDGKTPLIYAIENKNYHIINNLIMNNANIDLIDKNGDSIFLNAVKDKDNTLINLLLMNNVDLEQVNSNNKSNIEYLVESDIYNYDYINTILKTYPQDQMSPKNKQLFIDLALWDAVSKNDNVVAKELILQGADLNYYYPNLGLNAQYIPHYAIEVLILNDNEEMIKYLDETKKLRIDNNVINAMINTLTISEDSKVFSYLKNSYEDQLIKGMVQTVINNGNDNVFELLVGQGADKYLIYDSTNAEQINYLYYAIQGGSINIIDYLINKGFDINAEVTADGKKITMLKAAIDTGDIEVVEFLIKKGAVTPQ